MHIPTPTVTLISFRTGAAPPSRRRRCATASASARRTAPSSSAGETEVDEVHEVHNEGTEITKTNEEDTGSGYRAALREVGGHERTKPPAGLMVCGLSLVRSRPPNAGRRPAPDSGPPFVTVYFVPSL